MNIKELKELIVHTLDVDQFLDIIGVDFTDLVNRFEEEIEESFEELKAAVE